jgi:serine phosphatase RsbU (regulator of sigma subunit)
VASIAGEYRASDFRDLLGELFRDGNTAVIGDVRESLSPAAAAVMEGFALRSVLAVPLLGGGETVAALFAGMAFEPRSWTPDEVDTVQQIATLTRVAVEAASVSARERAIAAHLQSALQPPLPGPIGGLDLAVHYRSALDGARVGGDFYDVFPLEDGAYALVVGDLSGKGLAAAAQVATVRNMLRYALLNSGSLAEPLERLNRTLARNGLLVGFATLFVGRFDAASKILTYVNCGQEPGIVRHGGGGVDYLAPTGPTLGIAENGRYSEETVALRTGDLLALYTDGFTETGPNRGDPLGPEGVGHIMEEADPAGGVSLFVKTVVDRVTDYGAGAVRDDMCLLAALVL